MPSAYRLLGMAGDQADRSAPRWWQVLQLTGGSGGAREALRRAIEHYELKGTTAYVAHARRVAAEWGEVTVHDAQATSA